MEEKTVQLIIPGAEVDSHRQIIIRSGMTTNTVLAQENLPGYHLSLGEHKPFLADTDDVYERVEHNGKLYATPIAQQG